jgi:putative oxidoreductase
MSTTTSLGLLLLRVAIGGLMLVHGVQKINGFSELADNFGDPIGLGSRVSLILAIGAEVGCSLLLIVGLATRLAAIPLAFTMIVAHFIVHAEDAWTKKELSAVYLSVYLALVLAGPGRFSLDHLIMRRRRSPADEAEVSR